MNKKYTIEHTGYPVAGRPIRPEEWKPLSFHSSERAAWRAVRRYTDHLQPGQWDDHYRVIAPDGSECDPYLFEIRSEMDRIPIPRRSG